MGMINRRTICKLYDWNYSNFCKHLNGAGCREETAEKYVKVLGGSTDPWLLPNKGVERTLIYERFVSKQAKAVIKKIEGN